MFFLKQMTFTALNTMNALAQFHTTETNIICFGLLLFIPFITIFSSLRLRDCLNHTCLQGRDLH